MPMNSAASSTLIHRTVAARMKGRFLGIGRVCFGQARRGSEPARKSLR